jgi:Tfp pilus assembly protein PilV
MRSQTHQQKKTLGERGSMLIELLISMSVLAIGLGGVLALLISAVLTNSKAGKDTSATMVAENILEQISAQPGNATGAAALLQITDCAGTIWTIDTNAATLGAGTGLNGGNGANLTNLGVVDWTQSYATVPANYAMRYVACGNASRQMTYDVRWNVVRMTTNNRAVVISARPVESTAVGGLKYVVPVNLRTVDGTP